MFHVQDKILDTSTGSALFLPLEFYIFLHKTWNYVQK